MTKLIITGVLVLVVMGFAWIAFTDVHGIQKNVTVSIPAGQALGQ